MNPPPASGVEVHIRGRFAVALCIMLSPVSDKLLLIL